MIKVEIKQYDPDEEWEETFDTLKQATDWLCMYGYRASIWVNGNRATLKNGVLHIESARPVPTNPATYAAKGEVL